jgi:hypothetical protein
MIMALCPECRSADGHYKLVFGQTVVRGNICARCNGTGIASVEAVWIFTHQDKPGWYSWTLTAPSQEELNRKLTEDCGRLVPMELHAGLIPVQMEKEKIPAVHRPYSEIKL